MLGVFDIKRPKMTPWFSATITALLAAVALSGCMASQWATRPPSCAVSRPKSSADSVDFPNVPEAMIRLRCPAPPAPEPSGAQRIPPVEVAATLPLETPPRLLPPPAPEPPPRQSPPDEVIQASYNAPELVDWRRKLSEAIEAIESQSPTDSDAQRAVEAKPVLLAALDKLAKSAPLVVGNLAFCTEVQSFGCVKRFEKYEFAPGQEVLLYAEIDNFVSESTPKGHQTSLQSGYEVVDASGRRVAEHVFAPTEEYCQNPRRDFFIGYHLRLPKDIGPGRYRLRLAIEDLKSRKTGRAEVEFEVKAEKS